jgi:hypothetical protein
MDLFDELGVAGDGASKEQAVDLLRELERNTSDDVRRKRTHFRMEVKAGVILQPGSVSDRMKLKMLGTVGDLSQGGCRALFPLPVGVGDVFRLEFDVRQLDIPVTFVQCVRCRMLRDDAYEVGFRFFAPIAFPENLHAVSTAAQNS